MVVGGGDHLNSAIHQGGSEKFYSYSRGITKNLQNLKNFQSPPVLVKNDTSLIANLKEIRYESTSLNRIVADKSHRVIVA